MHITNMKDTQSVHRVKRARLVCIRSKPNEKKPQKQSTKTAWYRSQSYSRTSNIGDQKSRQLQENPQNPPILFGRQVIWWESGSYWYKKHKYKKCTPSVHQVQRIFQESRILAPRHALTQPPKNTHGEAQKLYRNCEKNHFPTTVTTNHYPTN